jgi:hypothetical protein
MRDNEDRANTGQKAVDRFSDRNYRYDGEPGLRSDITDVMADLLHLGERYGLEPLDLLDKARRSFDGDSEDGPPPYPRDPAELVAPTGADRIARLARELVDPDYDPAEEVD